MPVANVYANYNKTETDKSGQLILFILCCNRVNVSNTIRIETEDRGSNSVIHKYYKLADPCIYHVVGIFR